MSSLLREIGQVENSNTSRVVRGDIVIDIDVLGILDFIAVDVVFRPITPHHNVVGLSDVETRVRRAFRHGIFYQHVLALRRIDGIRPVARIRSAGPLHAHPANDHSIATLHRQSIAGCVFNREILSGEIVRLHQQSGRAFLLSRECQDRFVHALPADGHAIHGQRQSAVKMKLSLRQRDHVSALGLDQFLLQMLLKLFRGFRVIAGNQYQRGGCQRSGEKVRSVHSSPKRRHEDPLPIR